MSKVDLQKIEEAVNSTKGKIVKETDISRIVKPESDGQLVLEKKGK